MAGAASDARIGILGPPDAVDAVRFETLALAGRDELRRDPRRAASTLRGALELWRGPTLADAAEAHFAQAAAARLEELRQGALEDRIEADRGPRGPRGPYCPTGPGPS